MKARAVVLTVAAAGLLAGCQQNRTTDGAGGPPPEPVAIEPYPVEPMAMGETVVFDPVEPAPQPSRSAAEPASPQSDVFDAAAVESVPVSPPRVHVVQKNDTLWSIAVKYYDDGKMWQEIAQANGISNPQQLRVGQELRLP